MKLTACAEMSGIPRPLGLHKYKVRSGQVRSSRVIALNELKTARILVLDVVEERGHGGHLVGRARKVFREAASGYTRGDLGAVIHRTANASDPRTYKSVVVR